MFGFKTKTEKAVSLEDVTPLHPNDYPAKHLRERLEARRELLSEIKHHNPTAGFETLVLDMGE